MGRPKHYTYEDIKNVIDMYVSYTGGTVLLKASKIAEYAEKKLGLIKFKYYTINRNSDAVEYKEKLNKEISGIAEKKLTSAVTTFTQINVKLYQSMSKEELGKALMNINTLMEDMVDSNTILLKENLGLKDTVRENDIEIKKLNNIVNELVNKSTESMEKLKNKITEQSEIINKLTQSVKQSDHIMHLLWDKEVETIMKHTGVFENDGEEINPKRIITDIKESIVHVAKDANKLELGSESEKISYKFIERLNNI